MQQWTATDQNGRILCTTEKEEWASPGSFLFDFPEDFDFAKQHFYLIKDGELVYELPPKTPEEIQAEKEAKRRAQLETATLMFVRTAALSDEQALEVSELYEEWSAEAHYDKDYICRYKDELYRCVSPHDAQESWTPDAASSLWAKVLPGQQGEIGEWKQPGSMNPYMKGDKVTHKGKTWESLVDNNVWEPGVVGTESLWKEVKL